MKFVLAFAVIGCGGSTAPATPTLGNQVPPPPPAPPPDPDDERDRTYAAELEGRRNNTGPRRRYVEAELQLLQIEKRLKTLFIERAILPPSSTTPLPGPDGEACRTTGGKIPTVPASTWFADPAWDRLKFHIDEPALFTYRWTQTSATSGFATAVADLDCDGRMGMYRLEIRIVDGNVQSKWRAPTPD